MINQHQCREAKVQFELQLHFYDCSLSFLNYSKISMVTHNNNIINRMIEADALSHHPPIEAHLKSSDEAIPVGAHQEQPRCSRICEQIKVLKFNLAVEAVRVSLYLVVAFGIFYAFERTSHVSLHEQTYFSSEQVVYASQIRGLFPPIQGSHRKLINKWRISYTNTLESDNHSIYNNYTLEFKSNNKIRIKYRGCEGDLFMNWQSFQYNLFISGYSFGQDADREMIIEPDEDDTKCIRGDSTFIEDLKHVSIWTIFEENLYLLVEKWNGTTNSQYIILLGRD